MRLYAIDKPFASNDPHSVINAAIFELQGNPDKSITFVEAGSKQELLTTAPVTNRDDPEMGYGKISLETEDGTTYYIGHVKAVLPAPVALALLMQYGK